MNDLETFRNAISENYVDGGGLVTPNPCPKSVLRGSDNGPMYYAEFLIIAKRLGDTTEEGYGTACLDNCIDANTGLLQRVQTRYGATDQEGPDDYYGALNAYKQYGRVKEARGFLKAAFRYFGCFNNANPGTWTAQSFLIRQPQLLCSIITTAFPSMLNPLHWGIRLLAFPLYVISAAIIATSCYGVPTGDTDSRRLSWHLVQVVKDKSLLCYLASKLWYKRLYKDYGIAGMKAVALTYYKGLSSENPHPFAKYWID